MSKLFGLGINKFVRFHKTHINVVLLITPSNKAKMRLFSHFKACNKYRLHKFHTDNAPLIIVRSHHYRPSVTRQRTSDIWLHGEYLECSKLLAGCGNDALGYSFPFGQGTKLELMDLTKT